MLFYHISIHSQTLVSYSVVPYTCSNFAGGFMKKFSVVLWGLMGVCGWAHGQNVSSPDVFAAERAQESITSQPTIASVDPAALEKDIAYCSGLTASLIAVHPDDVNLHNAVAALTKIVETHRSVIDVEQSHATAQGYTVFLQNVRGTVPDYENPTLAVVVGAGLESCKRIGVTLFSD